MAAFLDKVTHFLQHEDDELRPPEAPQHSTEEGGLESDTRAALRDSIQELKRAHKKHLQLPELPDAPERDEHPIDAVRGSPHPASTESSAPEQHPEATKRALKQLLSGDDERRRARGPADDVFHLHSGETIDSLQQLAAACEQMPPHVFEHHVTAERNDFADWIKHNFSEKLAFEATQCASAQELGDLLKQDAAGEQRPALEDSFAQLKRELAQVREEIVSELDEEFASVQEHEERIERLRDDLAREQESFRAQQQALRQEVERLQQEQAMFEETIHRVEEQNKQLFEEHEQAKQTREEVARLRSQLRDEHDELKQAKQVLQQHLEQQQSQHRGPDLLELIDQVQADVAAKRWDAARSGYRRVSEAFEKADLDDEHRREVYNIIRGLYADIHLHAISD